MGNKPLVSICCATYNHEKYIEDALKGFLMQEDIDYEILIHDDASTDETAEIIKKYEEKYPDKIFPIYQTENQYSQGKKYSDLNYERVKGKYVAICEGDDYWIDSKKLKKQVEAMENNLSCDICFHPAIMVDYEQDRVNIIAQYSETDDIIPIEKIITKRHGLIPTASLLMKKEILDKVLEYKSTRLYLTVGDLYFQIFGSMRGGALFINKPMSVYRYLTTGSWTEVQRSCHQKRVHHVNVMCKSYGELNSLTEFKYTEYFQITMLQRVFAILGHEEKSDILPEIFYKYKELIYKLLDELYLLDETYVIYGSGSGCEFLLNHKISGKVEFLIDRDIIKKGNMFLSKEIKYIEKLKKLKDKKIIISLIGRGKRIEEFLLEEGIKENNIINFDAALIEANLVQ